MSNIDHNKTDNSSDSIDFESSVSDPSSGEVYEPSVEFDSDDSRSHDIAQSEDILERVNNSLGATDSALEETKYLLRLIEIKREKKQKCHKKIWCHDL